MTKDDIRENAFETAASIRNTVWFGTSIDNNVINSLYDDLVLELEQMKRDVEKHRMVTETVYSVIMQLLHDLDFPNRRRLSDRVVMPHREFFTSNDVYSMERLEQRKQTRLLTFKPPKGFFIGKNGRYDAQYETSYQGIRSIYFMEYEIISKNLVKFHRQGEPENGYYYGLNDDKEICDVSYSLNSLNLLRKLGKA